MNRVALIDGDIFAYKAASVAQVVSPFDKEKIVRQTHPETAFKEINRLINDAADAIDATGVIVCLTDRGNEFRKDLWPEYKQNRKGPKPALLLDVLEFIKREWTTYLKPKLEADDVMGILSTGCDIKVVREFDERVIVSADKDMKTVPGLLYNPDKGGGVVEVTELEADRNFILQALTGDTTDGYPGVPGIGAKSVFAAGIRAASSVREAWDILLRAGTKQGKDGSFCLTQARLARILRFDDYDFKRQTPHLWVPPSL